jgi:bla regulator protein BlaR1
MVHYFMQVVVFQLAFLLIYDVVLKKETFFNWNRIYLIVSALISVVMPFVKIDGFKEVIPQQFIINLPEVIIGNVTANTLTNLQIERLVTESKPLWTWETILYLGMVLATLFLVFKITKIVRMLSRSPKSKMGNLFIIKLQNSNAAFSFFHYIFLGELLNENDKKAILKHEIIHVQEKHTLDLLFFEILRILFWFNPLIYMYQNRIMTLHEFIADKEAVKHQDKTYYYQNLLSQVFETKNISFINPFFKQSLIKKRIVMLQKSKSKQVYLLKYALLVPIILGMLIYTSCIENVYSQQREPLSVLDKIQNTPLIEKIKAIGNQLQIQGYTNEVEDKGLNLLLKIIKQNDLDAQLVEEVQAYTSIKSKTDLTKKISDVLEQIQIQGNITEPEEKTLKELLILTSDDGFNDPFFANELVDVEVPFGVVDEVPEFPGCEVLLSKEEKKECFSKNVTMFVNKNFNTQIGKGNGLVGNQRINVIFKINNQGNVVDVNSRASHTVLEAEAIRVIKMFPKMTPGKQRGKAVNVIYSLPIVFQIAEEKKTDEKK